MYDENPLTESSKIALGVIGAAIVVGVGALLVKSLSGSSTSNTLPFSTTLFAANTSTTPPVYAVGASAGVQESTGSFLQGTITSVVASANGSTSSLKITQGDGATYPVGLTITGIPASYLF